MRSKAIIISKNWNICHNLDYIKSQYYEIKSCDDDDDDITSQNYGILSDNCKTKYI